MYLHKNKNKVGIKKTFFLDKTLFHIFFIVVYTFKLNTKSISQLALANYYLFDEY